MHAENSECSIQIPVILLNIVLAHVHQVDSICRYSWSYGAKSIVSAFSDRKIQDGHPNIKKASGLTLDKCLYQVSSSRKESTKCVHMECQIASKISETCAHQL